MKEFAPKLQSKEEEGEKNQEKLVEEGTKQAEIIAKMLFKKIKNKGNKSIELEDVVRWGQDGLIDAAEKFDPERKVKFLTYAKHRIRGGIIDGLREQSLINREHLEFLKKHKKAIESLQNELSRKPEPEEIAGEMNFTLEEYDKKLQQFPINSGVVSLTDFSNDNGHPEQYSRLDAIIQKRNNSSNGEDEDKKEKIEFLHKFSKYGENKRNRRIIDMCFIDNLTFKEIGKEFGLTEARVSQIFTKAINIEKLRKLFEKQGYEVSPNATEEENNNKLIGGKTRQYMSQENYSFENIKDKKPEEDLSIENKEPKKNSSKGKTPREKKDNKAFLTKKHFTGQSNSVSAALLFVGFKDDVYVEHNRVRDHEGGSSFWTRHKEDLEGTAYEIKQAIRLRLENLEVDKEKNHEEIAKVIETYGWLQQQFLRRGIKL